MCGLCVKVFSVVAMHIAVYMAVWQCVAVCVAVWQCVEAVLCKETPALPTECKAAQHTTAREFLHICICIYYTLRFDKHLIEWRCDKSPRSQKIIPYKRFSQDV